MTKKNISFLNEIERAYLIFKRETYYENIDLFLREEIAKFECSNKENEFKLIEEYIQNQNIDSEWFTKQLNSIGTNFLPKKINNEKEIEKKYNFISNLRTQDEYEVTEVNYFIKANLPIYLLSMLWSMEVGPYIDKELPAECFGNRLNLDEGDSTIKGDYRLFKLYIHQYNQWRDGAIQTGLETLEKENDVLLIALDFKQCFYNLTIKWNVIREIINKNKDISNKRYLLFLTESLEQIHHEYFRRTEILLSLTHKPYIESELVEGIPIGLPSSRILSNWELKKFDNTILQKLRPIFYGRYVDDVLIVLNNPDRLIVQEGPSKILKEYFLDNDIVDEKRFTNTKDEKPEILYKVVGFETLMIQNSKIIMHYYNHQHSWAGLKEFKEELRQKASEFRFLPEDDQYKDLVDEAYDIQYDGSIYRFRSVIGISENVTKLSHYLYKQQLKYWLCNDRLRDKTVEEIFQFYRGKNIFDYCRLWERVFTLFIVSQKYHNFYQFHRDLKYTINKLVFRNKNNDKNITSKIIEDCEHYEQLAMSLAIGYLGESISKEKTSKQFYALIKNVFLGKESYDSGYYNLAHSSLPYQFREIMYLRHQNMFWPLLDYSCFKGNLTKMDWGVLETEKQDIKLNDKKILNCTRFLHLDEYLLFGSLKKILSVTDDFGKTNSHIAKQVNSDRKFIHYDEILNQSKKENKTENVEEKEENSFKHIKEFFRNYIRITSNEDNLKLSYSIASDNNRKKDFCLGIVNIKVNEKDIEASYNPRKKPNTTYERQKVLFNLINQGIQEPVCDLIIFPEVSIPFSWLPFMVNQARRNNVGFIFGLEHVVQFPYALNLVATVLPFKSENQYHNVYMSLRLKNHFSPSEVHELSLFNLQRPDYGYLYEKFCWRGVYFPVYNCYELTDIQHRSLFRSDIDLLIAVEYNPDVNYFSNIIEAAARDIHCFAAQANSSDFGDSRVISPQKTEKMNIIRVKGGENAVLLKTFLDIDSLRDFQSREFSPSHNEFKPTPAGYDHQKARKRN
jgi:hypothetical protein